MVSGDSASITVVMPNLQSGAATQIFSGSFSKVIVVGADGDDTFDLSGLSGVPVDARGGKGNDTISGGSAGDLLIGGPGNDTLTGNGGADDDTVSGGPGKDTLKGGAGADNLSGGTGNDTIEGGIDTDPDVVSGDEGNDTVRGHIADLLYGRDGSDTVEAGLGTAWAEGGNGNDQLSFLITDPSGDSGRVSAELRVGRLIAAVGTTLYSGFESIGNIRFGSGDETLTINGNPGNVTVLLGNGNDTLIVKSSLPGSVITVDGQAGAGDRLIIDRTDSISPLSGSVGNGNLSGLGLGDVQYSNIEELDVLLGSGSDYLYVNGAELPVVRLDGGEGDDEIRFVPANVTLGLGNVVEVLGGPGSDKATIVFTDPSAITATPFPNWSLDAEVLRIEDAATGRPASDWSVSDRIVQYSGVDILDASGVQLVEFVGDSDGQDSFTVTSSTNESRRISIERDLIEIEGGQEILRPLSFLSEDEISIAPTFSAVGMSEARGVATSTDERYLYVTAGASFNRTLSIYQRHPTTGEVNFQTGYFLPNPGEYDEVIYLTDLDPLSGIEGDALAYVGRESGDAKLYVTRVDPVTGEFLQNPISPTEFLTQVFEYGEIYGIAADPSSPGVIYVSGRRDFSPHFPIPSEYIVQRIDLIQGRPPTQKRSRSEPLIVHRW